MSAQSYVRWFSDIRLEDVPAVGGKNASLGELYAMALLTPAQQHAVDQFAKSLLALGDDALIDTCHQAWENHR
jgi:hypothetical protein